MLEIDDRKRQRQHTPSDSLSSPEGATENAGPSPKKKHTGSEMQLHLRTHEDTQSKFIYKYTHTYIYHMPFLLHLLETSTHAAINNCTPQLYLGLCCMLVACMMLDPQFYNIQCNYFLGQIAARAAQPAVYAHVHILADHVTLSIG